MLCRKEPRVIDDLEDLKEHRPSERLTSLRPLSLGVLRVMREFAAKGRSFAGRVIGPARSLAVSEMEVDAMDKKAAVFYRNFGFAPQVANL